MFKKISLLITVFLAFAIFLSSCSDFTPLKGGPGIDDEVFGNGGAVVRKGNFIYYVNGTVSYKDLDEGDNDYGNVKNSAIYRLELDSNGNILKDSNGSKVEPELLVPKVAGYERGGIFIFDGKIYFSTPVNRKDRAGDVRSDLVDFYRVNIDGSNREKIYTTGSLNEGFEFYLFQKSNSVHLYTLESGLLKLNIFTGSSHVGPYSVVSNVTSIAFSTDQKELYYTRNLGDDDKYAFTKGNVLAHLDAGSINENILVRDNNHSLNLLGLVDSTIYYSKRTQESVSERFFARSLFNNEFLGASEVRLSESAYSDFLLLGNDRFGNINGIIVKSNDSLFLFNNDAGAVETRLISEDVKGKLILAIGDYVFYTQPGSDNGSYSIEKINYMTGDKSTILDSEDDINMLNDTDKNMNHEYNSGFLYFFTDNQNDNFTSNYIARVRVNTTMFEAEFIGVLEKDHIEDTDDTEDSE